MRPDPEGSTVGMQFKQTEILFSPHSKGSMQECYYTSAQSLLSAHAFATVARTEAVTTKVQAEANAIGFKSLPSRTGSGG